MADELGATDVDFRNIASAQYDGDPLAAIYYGNALLWQSPDDPWFVNIEDPTTTGYNVVFGGKPVPTAPVVSNVNPNGYTVSWNPEIPDESSPITLTLMDGEGTIGDPNSLITEMADDATYAYTLFGALSQATYSIEATYPATVGSIGFVLNEGLNDELSRFENNSPYMLFATIEDIEFAGRAVVSRASNTLTVRVYSEPNMAGAVLAERTIAFHFADNAANAPVVLDAYIEGNGAPGVLHSLVSEWGGDPHTTAPVYNGTLDGVDIVPQLTASSYTPVADDVGKTLVLTETRTNSQGSDTASASVEIAVQPPVSTSPFPDPIALVLNAPMTAIQSSNHFSNNVDSYSASGLPVGVTIDSLTGEISGTPTVEDTYTVIVTASNTAGATPSPQFSIEVSQAVVGDDNTIEFGALTPAGTGGAQGRNSTGEAADFTSIQDQPADRWEIVGGRLVYTGNGGMASEEITATAGGVQRTYSIVINANQFDVASTSDWDALNKQLSTSSRPNCTVLFRAGMFISGSKLGDLNGSGSGSRRTVYGAVTLRGELVGGLPSATFDYWWPTWFSGGTMRMVNMRLRVASNNQWNTNYTAIHPRGMATTNVELVDLDALGNPYYLEWPGTAAPNNDPYLSRYEFDSWGACLAVNNITGNLPAQHSRNTSVICSCNGRQRVFIAAENKGNGLYWFRFDDNGGKTSNINDKLGSEGDLQYFSLGATVSWPGGSGRVASRPAGATKTSGSAAFSFIARGPRFYYAEPGDEVVKTLLVHGCKIWGFENALHGHSYDETIIEENDLGYFAQDMVKHPDQVDYGIANCTRNPRLVIRRNLFHACMESGRDLYATHTDCIQTFRPEVDWQMLIYDNIFLLDTRGEAQGIFLQGGGGNPLVNSAIAGNIVTTRRYGNAFMIYGKNRVEMYGNTHIDQYDGSGDDVWTIIKPGLSIWQVSPASALYSHANLLGRFGSWDNAGAWNRHNNRGGGPGGSGDPPGQMFTKDNSENPWFKFTIPELMATIRANPTFEAANRDDLGALPAPYNRWDNFPKYVAPLPTAPLNFTPQVYLDPGDPNS